jgi:ABC-type transport system substrate-binding protein
MKTKLVNLLGLGLIGAALCVPAIAEAAPANSDPHADPKKVLRYAFEVAETSFDPQKISDLYSNIVNSAMFDTPLRYDQLARPAKMAPNTTDGMPEVSADYKTITVRIKPGTYFSDHEVFKGKKRELVAEDYVYSIKRLFDPKLSAPLLAEVEGYFVGSEEMMKRVRKANKMDYDTPLEGLKTLDRYTFQIKFNDPKPIWINNLADCRVSCALAREVVEHYGDDIGSHPVGTGAYKLTYWKRSSKMVFEANPNFREVYYNADPQPDDVEGQAILAKLKGRRLPMIGRFEVYIIEERQPRFLAFQRREHDLAWLLPEDFANLAIPGNKLAPNLKKLGIQMQQVPALDITFVYFNMEDPTVGGYTPEKVALRRAVSLAYKTNDEIQMVRKGQAVLAHTPYSPGVAGYDPDFKTSINEYNPAKARALLDMFGYVDKDGDGWRDMPDGSPLELKHNSTPTDRDRQLDEVWKRSMDEIGIKISIAKGKWPDHLKASNAGKLMMWQLGGSASAPDADTWLQTLYGPNSGFKGNRARFKLKAYDDAYEKASKLPDSPERTKLYQEMAKIVAAYAPWKVNTHRILTDLSFPYVVGFRRPLVQSQNWWMFADIDLAKLREYEGK